jgi:hypothetical protein
MQCFETGIDKSDTGTRSIRPRDSSLETQGLNAVGIGYSTADFDDLATLGNNCRRKRERKEYPAWAKIQNLDRAICLPWNGALANQENRIARKSALFTAW